MKQLATILSVVSLVLCGVLFYLFAHHTEQLKTISKQEEQRNTPNAFRIAYFDMDTSWAIYNLKLPIWRMIFSSFNSNG